MPATIVKQIVNAHRAQLQGLIQLGGIKKIRTTYESVRAEIEAQLADLRRRGQDQTFTAYHLRQVLLQVRDGLKVFQTGLADQLDDIGLKAATLAQRHVVGSIKAFEKRFAGTEPVLRLEEASVFARVYKGIEPTLLHRYHKLKGNYPLPTINRIRQQMAVSMIRGEGVQQAVDRIAAAGGLFDREKWRAERIVRTEGQYAYGVSNQRCLGEVAHEVPNLMKRLVATQDEREGKDSKALDGQVVPFDKPFVWLKTTKAGVERIEYMAPPNRPNDREVVVPWRADYGHVKVNAGEVQPRMPSHSMLDPDEDAG